MENAYTVYIIYIYVYAYIYIYIQNPTSLESKTTLNVFDFICKCSFCLHLYAGSVYRCILLKNQCQMWEKKMVTCSFLDFSRVRCPITQMTSSPDVIPRASNLGPEGDDLSTLADLERKTQSAKASRCRAGDKVFKYQKNWNPFFRVKIWVLVKSFWSEFLTWDAIYIHSSGHPWYLEIWNIMRTRKKCPHCSGHLWETWVNSSMRIFEFFEAPTKTQPIPTVRNA